MAQHLGHVALLVRDYDEAMEFFTSALGFVVREDTTLENTKRWIVVAPPGQGTGLLLAKAANERQQAAIGNQSGGRVFLFLVTDDFGKDYDQLRERGVKFLEAPRREKYGTVAVFADLYGNHWDLIEYTDDTGGEDPYGGAPLDRATPHAA
jgi:catechol 2,3-dioxygenase-like lactoylglutathione lyase family enzyme